MTEDSPLQFSLWSLFVLTTLCAIVFSALRTFGVGPVVGLLVVAAMCLLPALLFLTLRRDVIGAMSSDPKSPRTIVSVPSDAHAAPIVEALRGAGIRANAVGGYTSGFRAEAPGDVHVVVAQEDVGKAREVLSQIRAEEEGTEWSQVDLSDDHDELLHRPGSADRADR